MAETILVRLGGMKLFWFKNDDGSGALAPPDHLDDDGHVTVYDAFFSNSYAHVYRGGEIKRYGEVIGTVDDLEFLPLAASESRNG